MEAARGTGYDELDRIAHELRVSKAEYATGYWKLGMFYDGVCLSLRASEDRWTNLIAQLRLWVKARPESVTAHVALGQALREYAWKARGTDWAHTVTEKGWKVFYARLAESRDVFLSATNASEQCPLWFTGFLYVGLGEGWPRGVYERIFAAGTNHLRSFASVITCCLGGMVRKGSGSSLQATRRTLLEERRGTFCMRA